MSTEHEKYLLKQIAEIGAAINKRKRDELLQKVNATKQAGNSTDSGSSSQQKHTDNSTSSSTASVHNDAAVVSARRHPRAPRNNIPGGPNKKWVAAGVVDNYNPRTQVQDSSEKVGENPKGHVSPHQDSTRKTAADVDNTYASTTHTHTPAQRLPNRPPYNTHPRAQGPRGQNGQHLTWTAPGVPKQLPRGPALPRPTRGHRTGTRPPRATPANHTAAIAPGKKARVVSIGTTLFDVSEDLTRLTRRNLVSKEEDSDDLPVRVVIGEHVYHKADANEYKRNEANPKSCCKFYTLYGKGGCTNDPCQFLHDPDKIVLCRPFVTGTGCGFAEGECPLQHIKDRDRMPICTPFFIKGSCDRGEKCYDLHRKKSRETAVCKKYTKGYCPKGSECDDRHHWICPDFEFRGTCAAGESCPMRHYDLKPKPLKRKQNNAPAGFRIPHKKVKEDTNSTESLASAKADTSNSISIKPNLDAGFLRLDSDVVMPSKTATQTEPVEGEAQDTTALSIRPRFSFSQKKV